MCSPLSILSSKFLSTGLERPRGEAMPGVSTLWFDAGEVWNVENVEQTDLITIVLMAEHWSGLKLAFCWRLGMSSLGSDSITSLMEDNEAWSDRALSSLSSCSCLRSLWMFRRGGRLSASPGWCASISVLLVECPCRALACDGCF